MTIDGLKAKREQIIHQLHIIRATLFANNELVGETQGEFGDETLSSWLSRTIAAFQPKCVPLLI